MQTKIKFILKSRYEFPQNPEPTKRWFLEKINKSVIILSRDNGGEKEKA